jgi:hypothetical protein
MNKKIILLIIFILAVVIGYCFVIFKIVQEIAFIPNNFEECASQGFPVLESRPKQCYSPDGSVFSENNGIILRDFIKVVNPTPNQLIQSPLIIEGEARGNWFFEASFPVKLLDENNEVLGTTIATALTDWMTTDFVPFRAEIEFETPIIEKGKLVLEKDNPSGLPENSAEFIVPVNFNLNPNTSIIKVYFNNSKLDPEFSCNKVFPVEREIPKTEAIAKAALEELLKGPTQKEKNEGFFSNINSGVKIQRLVIENKKAKVDFDEQLEFQVGGSCRVAAIRAEITETLKQFPTIESVIISINNRTEDILQP